MGIVLTVIALFGLLASFTLIHETLEVAKNPAYEPSCNISPLVSCSSVMAGGGSELFGLPFPVYGAAAFGALLAFAVLLAVGTKFTAIIWKLALAASLGGILAIAYMIGISMYSYGSICPWCFGTWLVTIGAFWSIITYIASARPIELKGKMDSIAKVWSKYAPMLLIAAYAILIFILLARFNEVLV